MKRHNKLIFLLTGFTLLVFSVVTVFNFQYHNEEKETIRISLNKCNAQIEKCRTSFDGIELEVLLENNIQYLKNFNVKVLFHDSEMAEIESVYINFKMNNMNMGLNRFLLTKNKTKDKMMWSGKAVIPICVTGRADWISELEVISKNKKYILSFPITVKLTAG